MILQLEDYKGSSWVYILRNRALERFVRGTYHCLSSSPPPPEERSWIAICSSVVWEKEHHLVIYFLSFSHSQSRKSIPPASLYFLTIKSQKTQKAGLWKYIFTLRQLNYSPYLFGAHMANYVLSGNKSFSLLGTSQRTFWRYLNLKSKVQASQQNSTKWSLPERAEFYLSANITLRSGCFPLWHLLYWQPGNTILLSREIFILIKIVPSFFSNHGPLWCIVLENIWNVCLSSLKHFLICWVFLNQENPHNICKWEKCVGLQTGEKQNKPPYF